MAPGQSPPRPAISIHPSSPRAALPNVPWILRPGLLCHGTRFWFGGILLKSQKYDRPPTYRLDLPVDSLSKVVIFLVCKWALLPRSQSRKPGVGMRLTTSAYHMCHNTYTIGNLEGEKEARSASLFDVPPLPELEGQPYTYLPSSMGRHVSHSTQAGLVHPSRERLGFAIQSDIRPISLEIIFGRQM